MTTGLGEPRMRMAGASGLAAVAFGVASVVCLVLGQTWFFEHVERSVEARICSSDCGVISGSSHVGAPVVVGAVSLLMLLVTVGFLVRTRTGGAASVSRVAVVVAGLGIVLVSSVVTVLVRLNWFRDSAEDLFCEMRRTDTGGLSGCLDPNQVASGWWVVAGLVFACVSLALAGRAARPAE